VVNGGTAAEVGGHVFQALRERNYFAAGAPAAAQVATSGSSH
jgi:hypothetical protein